MSIDLERPAIEGEVCVRIPLPETLLLTAEQRKALFEGIGQVVAATNGQLTPALPPSPSNPVHS